MKFSVYDLKRLGRAARKLGRREAKSLEVMIHRAQPEFCQLLDDVGMDPRCLVAYRFSTAVCALALRHFREVTGRRPALIPVDAVQDLAPCLVQRRWKAIGKRAVGYRSRIRKHVLLPGEFDSDDSNWLCTMLSAFLLVLEGLSPPQRAASGSRAILSAHLRPPAGKVLPGWLAELLYLGGDL
jgi:hypothetical protein